MAHWLSHSSGVTLAPAPQVMRASEADSISSPALQTDVSLWLDSVTNSLKQTAYTYSEEEELDSTDLWTAVPSNPNERRPAIDVTTGPMAKKGAKKKVAAEAPRFEDETTEGEHYERGVFRDDEQ